MATDSSYKLSDDVSMLLNPAGESEKLPPAGRFIWVTPNARIENLILLEDGAYSYRLTQSKTDQAGTEHNPDADKPIVGTGGGRLERVA